METVIGLNLNHHDICLFTKCIDGEGLPEFNKFIYETLHDAVHLVARRLEEGRFMKISERCRMVLMVLEEYQYATMSSYSPPISDLPLKCELKIQVSSNHHTDVD